MLDKKENFIRNGKKVTFEVLDARCVRVYADVASRCYVSKNGSIKTVVFGDEFNITLSSFLSFDIAGNIHNYYVDNIIEEGSNTYLLVSEKRSKSSYFAFPVIGKNREYFRWSNYFINAYISIGNDLGKFLYLKYRFINSKDYKEFETNVKDHNDFITSFDPNSNIVILKFNIPKDKQKEIIKFINGKYSSFSDNYKIQILKFHGKDKFSEFGKILYKDKNRLEQLELDLGVKLPHSIDLYSKPVLSEEKCKEVENVKDGKNTETV